MIALSYNVYSLVLFFSLVLLLFGRLTFFIKRQASFTVWLSVEQLGRDNSFDVPLFVYIAFFVLSCSCSLVKEEEEVSK